MDVEQRQRVEDLVEGLRRHWRLGQQGVEASYQDLLAGVSGSRSYVIDSFGREVGESGHVYPNTPITSRWRLVPADRAVEPIVGPPVSVTYEDTRFAWRTLEGDIVRVSQSRSLPPTR